MKTIQLNELFIHDIVILCMFTYVLNSRTPDNLLIRSVGGKLEGIPFSP